MLNIKIEFRDEIPDFREVIEAKDVQDAEGKLAIMARHWQKVVQDHGAILDDHDCKLSPDKGCEHPSHNEENTGFVNSADVHEYEDSK